MAVTGTSNFCTPFWETVIADGVGMAVDVTIDGLGMAKAAAADIGDSSGSKKCVPMSGPGSIRVDKFSACEARDEVNDDDSVDDERCCGLNRGRLLKIFGRSFATGLVTLDFVSSRGPCAIAAVTDSAIP